MTESSARQNIILDRLKNSVDRLDKLLSDREVEYPSWWVALQRAIDSVTVFRMNIPVPDFPCLINPDSEYECIYCKIRFRISDGHECENLTLNTRQVRLTAAITLLMTHRIITRNDEGTEFFFDEREFKNPIQVLDHCIRKWSDEEHQAPGHKKYLQDWLKKVESKPMSDACMLISAVLHGYSRAYIKQRHELEKTRDGYYYNDCIFGPIKLFTLED